MALQATVRRLKLQLSDAERGVYEALDLRLAQHPSENEAFLVTRVLAYALCYEPAISFSHGLSSTNEPAVWVKTADGRPTLWIEIGTPSAERLHRASKACPKVVVFSHHDPQLLRKETTRAVIHRADQIDVYVPSGQLIKELAARVSRNMTWELVHSGGHLYVTADGEALEGELTRFSLG